MQIIHRTVNTPDGPLLALIEVPDDTLDLNDAAAVRDYLLSRGSLMVHLVTPEANTSTTHFPADATVEEPSGDVLEMRQVRVQ
jgi:hypothetical protein